MKEQDKIPEQQLHEVETHSIWKRIQSNDSEDNPRFWKKNGGTDWEDTRNI